MIDSLHKPLFIVTQNCFLKIARYQQTCVDSQGLCILTGSIVRRRYGVLPDLDVNLFVHRKCKVQNRTSCMSFCVEGGSISMDSKTMCGYLSGGIR